MFHVFVFHILFVFAWKLGIAETKQGIFCGETFLFMGNYLYIFFYKTVPFMTALTEVLCSMFIQPLYHNRNAHTVYIYC